MFSQRWRKGKFFTRKVWGLCTLPVCHLNTDLCFSFSFQVPKNNFYVLEIKTRPCGNFGLQHAMITCTFWAQDFSNGSRLTKTKFVRGLVSLDCRLRLLENYFCIIMWKKPLYLSFSGFSNLYNASARLFCTLSFAQSCKILFQFSKLSAILKQQRQKLCNDDFDRASVL